MKDFQKLLKQFKIAGIIVSIVMVVSGICALVLPIGTGVVFAWTLVASIIINGLFQVFRYVKAPAELKNGWSLACGILSFVFGAIVVYDIFVTPVGSTLSLMSTLSFFIAFYSMFFGISSLFSLGLVKKAGGSVGWTVFSGVLNILCAMFVLSHPILGYFALEFVAGIYLCVFGISMFCECIVMGKDNGNKSVTA